MTRVIDIIGTALAVLVFLAVMLLVFLVMPFMAVWNWLKRVL
jgi:hypothetical protein